MIHKVWRAYRDFRPFTDAEAWFLFRVAAFTEAIGWTLLIIGILWQKYLTPHSNVPVLLAGRTHGTLFLIYIVAVLVLTPSLRWRFGRTLIAGLCSAPPYGSLLFEMYEAHRRRQAELSDLQGLVQYVLLSAP